MDLFRTIHCCIVSRWAFDTLSIKGRAGETVSTTNSNANNVDFKIDKDGTLIKFSLFTITQSWLTT